MTDQPGVQVWLLASTVAIAFLGIAAAVYLRVFRGPRQTTSHPPGVGTSWQASLTRTRESMWAKLFRSAPEGPDLLKLVEEALLSADVGVRMTSQVLRRLADVGMLSGQGHRPLRDRLRDILKEFLVVSRSVEPLSKPHVIFLVGVNGVGKTTTVAKLANWFRKKGLRVLIVAADTFRAGAIQQLESWGARIGVECVRQKSGADPGAIVFDGLKAAVARGADVVLVDTAGRLHSKKNLMDELAKLVRVAKRVVPDAPHDSWLVLDATVGQNGLAQARSFAGAVPLTGVVVTKIDGTAKAGVVFAVGSELGVPVRFVGTGEGLEDLEEFDADRFVESILWGEDDRSAAASAA